MKLTYPPESKPLEGYTIKRAIARGGFGEVYYALSDAGKEVALKLLRQNLEVELRGVSQCLNLTHPNLVSIFDIRTDKQGDHWIIMEYVGGHTLDRVLDELAGPMPLDDVNRWLSAICSGLTYLHSRGLVHRDMKPANVFDHQGTVKIGDVGLSKFISHSQVNAHTQSVGTVYYMAPEVAHGRYGKTVDVYALGVMLFEMVTGEVPFDGESQAEILMKHLSEQPNLNRLPPRLRPVLARALEKDPNRRYQSAAELEREFERAAKEVQQGNSFANTIYPYDHKPASTPPPPPPRHRAPEMQHAMYQRPASSPYAGRGERNPGLGAGKWVLIGLVLFTMFSGRFASPHSMRMLLFTGMAVAGIYAVKRFSRYVAGTPDAAYPPPIDRRPQYATPTREELRYAAQLRRDQRVAALEARRAAVRQAREQRLAARYHQQGMANVSTMAKRNIPLRQRGLELSTSATFASVATVLMTAGLMLTSPFLSGLNWVLFGAVTILGSWAILATAKSLEGRGTSWSNHRLMLGLAGAGIGVVAWFLTTNLFLNLPTDASRNMAFGNLVLTDAARQPTLVCYALFFAGLFALRRWSWHADAFRDRRFRLRSVLLTTAIGWVWSAVIGFPILWGVTWAAALSSVVQLSACWVPPEDRYRLMMEDQNHV